MNRTGAVKSEKRQTQADAKAMPGLFLSQFVDSVGLSFQMKGLLVHRTGEARTLCTYGFAETEAAKIVASCHSDGDAVSQALSGEAVKFQSETYCMHGVFGGPSNPLLALLFESVFAKLGPPESTGERATGPYPPFIDQRRAYIGRLAASRAPILISGESGVGKEYLARIIHDMSRVPGPFVVINVAAIPETLFEAELFGFKKGAFSDSGEGREGKLAGARDGTLVLDEISNLSLSVQAKLLRVLEDGTYYPLGSDEARRLSCRIITLSAENLDELVKKSLFREDLFYRLNVLPFTMPPLRERKADIGQIAMNELARLNQQRGGGLSYSDSMIPVLKSKDWPGNVRELLNYIQLCALQSEGPVIDPLREPVTAGKTLRESINEYKQKLIHDILAECGGNITKAARLLGVQRTYLSKLINESGPHSRQENKSDG